MDNLIRKKLQDLIAHRGQGLCLEPERCKAAVKELCDRHPVEQFVLASIVDLGMLGPILALSDPGSWRDLATELTGRLQKERSLNHDSARWGVETWAVALGKLDEAALRASESVALGRSPEGITLDRRLLAAFIAGALYGFLLWLVGWAVIWGLTGPLEGALVGASLGLFRSVRDAALSPWVIAAWAVGGAAGVLLYQGTDGEAIKPLTGAVAWVLASVIGRAVFLGMGPASLHVAALAGVIGPAMGWPVAGLITAAVKTQLEAPWSWALVGLCAGALQGLLEESRRGWRFAVVQSILRAAMASVLALGAGFISGDQGGPLGWVLTGAAVWLVPGLLYRPHDRHAQTVWRVAISPSAHFALSASADGNIGLWELEQRMLVGFVRQQGGPVYAVAFSHDGLSCASGGADQTVRVVDGNTGDQRFSFSGHTDSVLSVAFSPADGLLASGSADNHIRIWDLSAGREANCLHGHSGAVTSVVFSRDGGRLLSASLDGTARIWDVVEGKETAVLAVKKPLYAALFTPDGRRILVAADDGLSLWDAEVGQLLRAFSGHAGAVYGVAVAADGERILSAGADATVRLWTPAGDEEACIRGHRGPVRGVAFAPDARSGISGGDDGSVRIFGFPDSPLGEPPRADDDSDGDFAS